MGIRAVASRTCREVYLLMMAKKIRTNQHIQQVNITKSVILTLTRGFHIVCTFGYLNIAYWSHEIWKQHSQFITNNRFRSCPEFLIKTADYRNTKWQLTTRKRSFPISEQLAVHQHPFPPPMKAQTYTFQTLHGSTLTVFSYLFWHITVCVGQHSASL